MPENKTEEPINLQWIKGDNQGNVETVIGEEEDFTLFQSGKRIYTNLIDEFMIPVTGTPLPFDEIAVDPLAQSSPSKPARVEKSALRILLDKQKKLQKAPMGISFSVQIPKKSLYEVLETSFDAEELETELTNFIEEQIDKDQLLQTVKDSIKILIQEKYKGV